MLDLYFKHLLKSSCNPPGKYHGFAIGMKKKVFFLKSGLYTSLKMLQGAENKFYFCHMMFHSKVMSERFRRHLWLPGP